MLVKLVSNYDHLFVRVVVVLTIFTNAPISFLSTPTGVETPDVIDLRKQQRKEPDRPLYQVS